MSEPTPYFTHRCLECQLMRCTRENDVCLECQNNKANEPVKPDPISFEELTQWYSWAAPVFCYCTDFIQCNFCRWSDVKG